MRITYDRAMRVMQQVHEEAGHSSRCAYLRIRSVTYITKRHRIHGAWILFAFSVTADTAVKFVFNYFKFIGAYCQVE